MNEYYKPNFERECEQLVNNELIDRNWFKTIIKLLEQGNVALIRLGKGGSESKVFSGGIAQIFRPQHKNIKKDPNKDKQVDLKYIQGVYSEASTIWLAANSKDATTNLLPFGWALLEVDPKSENEALKTWCEQQPKPDFDKAAIIAEREAKKAALQQQEAERLAKLQADQEAEQAKQTLLNSASENQKMVLLLVEKYHASRERQVDTSSPLLKETKDLISYAIEQWDQLDKQFIAQHISVELIKTRIDLKKKNAEKDLQKLLNKLSA
ncbi:hypothetical protein [Conservatibacter flavescens]|uniref:Uncharacterized protein n=1 Tax=Conservatibacter flavescens TaxID=28161 RepID=A0A2M8S3H5_9PAST|nr:hypothetical protein [Conservatibacter flavescens]PJG85618.1 hypothetical protein CVP05_05495 [Conservatibacter flavescens]